MLEPFGRIAGYYDAKTHQLLTKESGSEHVAHSRI
jgi:hypothetical protein